jgi:hypothetical protein
MIITLTTDWEHTEDINMALGSFLDIQEQLHVGGKSKNDVVVHEAEAQDDRNIESTMYYLEKIPLYETEKPYTMRYLPEDGIPQSNFQKAEKPISVINMRRSDVGPFKFDECGFELIELHSKMSYDDYWDNEKIQKVYIQEVRNAIKKAIGAKFVWVLDYAVSVPGGKS